LLHLINDLLLLRCGEPYRKESLSAAQIWQPADSLRRGAGLSIDLRPAAD
jgi:hypothetical protein